MSETQKELTVILGGNFAVEMEKEATARGLTVEQVASEWLEEGARKAFGLTKKPAVIESIFSGGE